MPLRSATADTVAPGSSASVRTLTFCSAVQRLRRSTREMISTLSISVLTHVFKDANAHDLRQHNKDSSWLTLTARSMLRYSHSGIGDFSNRSTRKIVREGHIAGFIFFYGLR